MSHEGGVDRFKNKQFALWLLVAIFVWVPGAMLVRGFAPSPWWGYIAGTGVTILLVPICDFFLDWMDAEREVARLDE